MSFCVSLFVKVESCFDVLLLLECLFGDFACCDGCGDVGCL